MATQTQNGFTTTHDGRMVYPAGHELPSWASGWTQCDNKGASYSVWLNAADQERSKADLARIEAEAKKLRTRAQCEAAMTEMGLGVWGTCKMMRLSYITQAYADLWPLRQVSR